MDTSLHDPKSELRGLIQEKSVMECADRWLVSPTDRDWSWLIDMRQVFLDAEALTLFADIFWDRFESRLPFQLGGMEIAGIPMVVALIQRAYQRGLKVNGFILRKERKPYGVGKLFEGKIDDTPILVVDDIINSAGSLEKVRATLEPLGRTIDSVFVVIDYKNPESEAWSRRHRIKVESLFSLADFGLSQAPASGKGRLLNRFENLWCFKSENANHLHAVPKSSPLVIDGLVIFGSDRGTLWALEILSGAVVWRFDTEHPGRKGIWSRPAFHDGKVYFGSYDGNLYCLDAATGREIWRNTDADWIGSSPEIDPQSGLLWIGLEHMRPATRGSVAAFDAATGEKRWEVFVPLHVHGTPAYSPRAGAVAVGGNDKALRLFDAGTGEIRWVMETQGEIKERPTFDDKRNLVYVTGFDGQIRAIDITSGELAWSVSTGNILYSSPTVIGNTLHVTGCDKNLHVIDLDSQDHVTIPIAAKSVSTPVPIDDSIFFGTHSGAIYELDHAGKKLLGRHQLPDPVTSRIAYCAAAKTFFGLTYMNELFAFKRSAP